MKQKHTFFKNSFTALALAAAAALTGCGAAADQNIEEVIVLQEPEAVDSDTNTEPVVRRNLYNATIYPTTVIPYIEEYSFDTDQHFGSYGPLLGDQVRKGDILMTASGQDLAAQINALEEQMHDMMKDYNEYCEEAEENLRKLQKELSSLQDILDNLDRQKPESAVSGNDSAPGDPIDDPEYAAWQAQRHAWQGEYNLVDYHITIGERELDQRRELYDLDLRYYNELLQELFAKHSEEIIRSQISGVVVALGDYVYGSSLPKDQPVIAVADLTKKYIRCSYIRERYLNNAAQIYAFIDGKRYDVTLYDNNKKYPNQTTFSLQDEKNEVSVGSYVVLVLMSDYREQALTVRTDAIHREDSKDIVYVPSEDGQSVPKEIKKGISDGLYTEVLSGLSEGESVIVSGRSAPGASNAVLQSGTIGNSRKLGGQLIYPLKTIVESPVTNGNVYLEKIVVKQNDYIQQGALLALINVEPDLISLNRREVSLARQKERLADLIALKQKEDEKTILLAQENIRKEEEALEQIRKDYATTQILAPTSGYVVYLRPRSYGEIISPRDPLMAYIADDNIAYLSISDSNGISASYGTALTITCTDSEGQEFTVEGRVITADNSLLSDPLKGNAKVIMPLEARKKMIYSEKKPVPVYFTGEQMKNVILVPRDAVTCAGDNTYVNLQNQDGTVTTISFLSGGSSNQYYWAIDGLTEGMVICWE